jgi:hypothetical protein
MDQFPKRKGVKLLEGKLIINDYKIKFSILIRQIDG